MKKLLVTTLTLGMISFMSISASAAGSATSGNFKCPNGNEICMDSKICLNDGQFTSYQKCFRVNPRMEQNTQNTKNTQNTQKSAVKMITTENSSYICPNGNAACTNNGSCINNGECENQKNCINDNIGKQGGGQGSGQGGGQGSGQGLGHQGHHGGKRGR